MASRHVLILACVLAILLCAVAPTSGREPPSTPKERAVAVRFARDLERDPLAPDASEKRGRLLRFFDEAPDIAVTICYFLGPLQDKNHPYFGDLIRQTLFSSGAFVIEHPDKSKDAVAVYVAGLEGALNAYEGFVKAMPDKRLQALDALVEIRRQGTLVAYVREMTPLNCAP